MTQTSSSDQQVFRAASTTDIITDALNSLLAQPDREGEETFTLIFAGEAASMEAALQDAIRDIQGLAVDHRGIPFDIEVDAVVRTDEGTRIWGSVSCVAGQATTGVNPAALSSRITIHQEGPTAWTLTIDRN